MQTQPLLIFFFFNDTATTEIYTSKNTLSLHDALPIYSSAFSSRPTSVFVPLSTISPSAA